MHVRGLFFLHPVTSRILPYLGTLLALLGAGGVYYLRASQDKPPAPTHALHAFKSAAPQHAAYSITTHWIEEGRYQEALEQAVRLHEEIREDPSLHLLMAYNLLRIAHLHKALHNPHGELRAWEELEALYALHPSQLMPLQEQYHRGQLSLFDYVAHRKEEIARIHQ